MNTSRTPPKSATNSASPQPPRLSATPRSQANLQSPIEIRQISADKMAMVPSVTNLDPVVVKTPAADNRIKYTNQMGSALHKPRYSVGSTLTATPKALAQARQSRFTPPTNRPPSTQEAPRPTLAQRKQQAVPHPYLEFGGLTDSRDAGLNTILEDSNLSGAMHTSLDPPNEASESYLPKLR